MLRSLAMRLYYLLKALRLLWGDAAYLISSRVAHFQMRLWRASSLSDYQLQSFIAWHCHQMEKTTKQLSKGSGENSRGWAHYQETLRYMEEYEKRDNKEDEDPNAIKWARETRRTYEKWSVSEGARNVADDVDSLNDEECGFSERVRNLLHERSSIRVWREEEVSDEVVRHLLESGLDAPSSCHRQGVTFVAVKRERPKTKKLEVNNPAMVENAPLIVYFCADPSLYPERFAPAFDAAMAAQNITVCAQAEGLGVCAMYQSESANQRQLRERLGLDGGSYIYLALLMGYPAERPKKPSRMPLSMRSKVIVEGRGEGDRMDDPPGKPAGAGEEA